MILCKNPVAYGVARHGQFLPVLAITHSLEESLGL